MEISVVIPTYNAQKYIEEALDSVLDQGHEFHEIICVDDASEDRTLAIIENKYPVKILQNEKNQGPSYTRNRGVVESSGSHIAFLDADDTWESHKTRLQIETFADHPELEVVGGLTHYRFMEGNDHASVRQQLTHAHFNTYLGSFLIKKSVFDQVGLFDESLKISEDQDWFLRIREANIKTKILEQTVLSYRVHDSNLTKDLIFQDTDLLKVLKMSLDRRRRSGNPTELDALSLKNKK